MKMTHYSTQITSGWYCANCGAFVPNGAAHQCPSYPSSTGGDYKYIFSIPSDRELLLKILEKFDEILKILKEK
jgi:hypothetical protein